MALTLLERVSSAAKAVRDTILKADVVPSSINEQATQMIRQTAASAAMAPNMLTTAAPATGWRPTAGPIPQVADEAMPPAPLRFQFPYAQNLSNIPRSGYGTPFSILRNLASTSPEVFMCVQTRKDQMASLNFDFAPRDKKIKGDQFKTQINAARKFFAKPDQVTPFATWVQTLVDEVLVIDALSIYKRKTKGGQIFGYEIIDGSTIKLIIDDTGKTPFPPAVAYRQIIYGTPVAGGDCTTEDLLYLPKNVRTWSPYGMSPTEAVMLIVTSALNRTLHNLSYYVSGNIPEALVGVPDQWTPDQIQQFNEYWNLVLAGDPTNRSRLRFVTETMAKNVHEFRQEDFSTHWELWLLKVICACFGVTPSEVGFTDDVNKATSQTQGDVNQRRGVKPMAGFIKGILDAMLATDLGMPELETVWSGGEGEDALGQARIQDFQLKNGIKSIDEIRAQNGDPTLGIGPCVITASGPILWSSVLEPKEPAPAPGHVPAAPGEPTLKPNAAQQAAQQQELKKYRTVATKAVERGKPVPPFISDILSSEDLALIAKRLSTAKTVEDVQKVFEAGDVAKSQVLSSKQKKHQSQMAAKLTQVLADERKAFLAHIEGAGA